MNTGASLIARADAFSARLGIRIPILLAPMSGACPPSLSAAVANAGGMGACGALLMSPESIHAWVDDFCERSRGEFQLNVWVPDPPAPRDFELEERQREFLAAWGPLVSPELGATGLPEFEAQCEAKIAARPKVISSIMGLYAPTFVSKLKEHGILWFATATTVAEAKVAEQAGADAIIAQGMEAGGHRGAFHADEAESQMVGLFALLPQVADAVSVPVIAAGGIADDRGVAAALMLGASAVQIGTGFLRSPESSVPPAYARRIGQTEAHETIVTRAFTGRAGRCIKNEYVRVASARNSPAPAPYPTQRGLTRALRETALKAEDTGRMQMWAGQAAKLAQEQSAGDIARQLWTDATRLMS